MSKKIDPGLLDMLRISGRAWEIESGKKHIKLKVEGRVVLVLPLMYKNDGNRQGINARATLRRHLKILEATNV